MRNFWIVLAGLVVIIALVAWGVPNQYNTFVRNSLGVDEQWAQVETQYQRRFDLIPNLVESVKGMMAQEQAVFIAIAEARTRYAGARTVDQRVAAAGEVETALARLLVIMENYPELRSAQTVLALMDELAGTENRIAVERRRFNEQVRVYNASVKTFPGLVLAGMFGFRERPFFEAAPGTELAPRVAF